MRLLFIQRSAFPAFGPMFISAFVKKEGFDCDLILAGETRDLIGPIREKKTDVIAFPVFTGEHHWVAQQAIRIKKALPRVQILLGGPHVTYYPEEAIKCEAVDFLALGEAEEAIAELLNAQSSHTRHPESAYPPRKHLRGGGTCLAGRRVGGRNEEVSYSISNIWRRDGSEIHKEEMGPLVEDLDSLPNPDRSIYYQYPFLAKASVKQFLTGRGCPYSCAFCANAMLRKLYKGKGKYVRRRSPERVVEEAERVKREYGLETASFTDDVFAMDKGWLSHFLPLLKKRVGVPFLGNVTANLVDRELIEMLKDGGCYGLAMGIESGNEKLRQQVLQKRVTNEQILRAGKLIKEAGLKLKTYNILSLPGETVENAIETIKINAAIYPDHASCSLLQPYPKYPITEYAIEKGFLPEDYGVEQVGESLFDDSPILSPHKKELLNLQTFFFIGVKAPWALPLIRVLIKLPPNPVYRLISKAFYGIYMSRVHKLTLKDMLRYALHIDPFKV